VSTCYFIEHEIAIFIFPLLKFLSMSFTVMQFHFYFSLFIAG
jgi:hypothetical protein